MAPEMNPNGRLLSYPDTTLPRTVAPSPAAPPTAALAGNDLSPAALFHSVKFSAFHAGRVTAGGVTQLVISAWTSATRMTRSSPLRPSASALRAPNFSPSLPTADCTPWIRPAPSMPPATPVNAPNAVLCVFHDCRVPAAI
ncbi:hypothetical protein OG819_40430 [Streptomyces sp. NBC_01549]|uniref:hypothetical protein n=1 Tax=Streptomyces sp. NBC_01549 TaxID=2975874 RepID=UPI002254DD34|nr:hypothetical protein [Streptomyces sp. NBC_01549]MCX4595710.1 hypothetical protein [Streptomyces sp. NBC_01549]